MRWLVYFIMLCWTSTVYSQDKHLIQIKTFDHQLKPLVNQEVSLSGKQFIPVGSKGAAFVEVPVEDLPPKSIAIKDEQLEAESWNYSKGVLEIILRKKSYQAVEWVARNESNKPIPNLPIQFKGRRSQSVVTDSNGKFKLQLALDEQIADASQFTVDGFKVTAVDGDVLKLRSLAGNDVASARAKNEQSNIPKDYFKNFDLAMLDSIQSLTVFYAIFKNYQIKDFTAAQKSRIDQKFSQLVQQLQDSVKKSDMFIGKISSKSLVRDDINNLLAQAEEEKQILETQRADFDEKIKLLNEKLAAGFENLDDGTRSKLLVDINLLEKLLLDNENQFYRNQNDYRSVISSLKERYFDYTDLETRLSESELRRLEEKRLFTQRLILILSISFVFALLIVLLIRFSNKLRKQKMQLEEANAEVKRMNENLEILVYVRTKLLAEAHKELDTFLYRASHDLRSPVCSIIGLCNIASSQLPSGESKELIDRVVSTTENMDKLLKKLSLISEINQPSNFSEIDLREALEGVRYRFRHIIKESKIQFIISCNDDIVLNSYPNLVTAILTNTIENALYYTSLKDKVGGIVKVDAALEDNRVRVTVYDNGIGMDETIQPRIFDMFYKGNIRSKGNGLGLYIVHKSLQTLDGEVRLESVAGEYSKFTLFIPVNAEKAKAEVSSEKLEEAVMV